MVFGEVIFDAGARYGRVAKRIRLSKDNGCQRYLLAMARAMGHYGRAVAVQGGRAIERSGGKTAEKSDGPAAGAMAPKGYLANAI